VTPKAYKRFCSETVILARLPQMIYKSDEVLKADLELAHFGAGALNNVTVYWKLVRADDNHILSEGKWKNLSFAIGNHQQIGGIEQKLSEFNRATKIKFIAGIEGTAFENDWDIWVYPADLKIPESDIIVTSEWNESAKAALEKGKPILLVLKKRSLNPGKGGDVAVGFSSIFWNTSWTRGQAPHTLGILCDPKHKVFEHFPTEFHSNWQWWELIHNAQAMVLDDFDPSLDPPVKMIDTWFSNRRLALLLEVQIGKGKVMVCTMDILSDLDKRPSARQLYFSIISYMQSRHFNPETRIRAEELDALIQVKN
jgi:hypothetical protein